jgi:dienelactone hydrolase
MTDGLDPHRYAMERIALLSREFCWSPGSADPDLWASQLRERLIALIGGIEVKEFAIRERRPVAMADESHFQVSEVVTFAWDENMNVTGYWLEPEGGDDAPVLICVPGHGKGVDALVGLAPSDYQNQFALQALRQGFRVLAIEPCSFGHRKSTIEEERESSCNRDAMAALMLGETLVGWRVRDAIAAVHYALSRGAKKVGIVGISGGGLVALWTAALDTRIDACVVSGYFNTFYDSILSIDHCVDNFVPGLAKVVEMPDMAALIHPRGLFVESGTDDPIFPREAFLKACERAREIYQDSENFASELFEGGHQFWGREAFPFLNRVLT